MDRRAETGRLGEDAAARLYAARGYRVLARNWRCRLGELDVIASRDGVVVICEVKTRRGLGFGGGYEAVGARKQAKIRSLAQVYLTGRHEAEVAMRFDVASVRIAADGSTDVELFEDAF